MEQKVGIDRAEFAFDLLARFNDLRKSNKYCDFVIRAGKKELPVHRFVLAANSEYFDGMLGHDTIENIEGVVEIKEVDPECVVKCVDFMYTGEAVVSEQKQRDLMHVAHMLRLHRLYNGIAIILEEKLDFSTFLSSRHIAIVYDCGKLLEACDEFALKNFETIATFEFFKKLELEYVKFLLSSNILKKKNTIKLKALMIWINHSSDRNAALVDLMKLIDLKNVSLSYRRFVTEYKPAVSGSNECLHQIMKSMYARDDVGAADITLEDRIFQRRETRIVVCDNRCQRLKSFDPFQRTWDDLHMMHEDMRNKPCSAVCLDEYIYVFPDEKCFRLRYLEHDANWEQLACRNEFPVVAVTINGNIYARKLYGYCNRVECYDPEFNSWSFIPDIDLCLANSSFIASDKFGPIRSGKVFVIGGSTVTELSDAVLQFDTAMCSWSKGPSLIESRSRASATSLHGAIYVFGGSYKNEYFASAEFLHPDSETWQIVRLDHFCYTQFMSFTINEKIYMVGHSENQTLKGIAEYDPSTEELETVTTFDDKFVTACSSVAI